MLAGTSALSHSGSCWVIHHCFWLSPLRGEIWWTLQRQHPATPPDTGKSNLTIYPTICCFYFLQSMVSVTSRGLTVLRIFRGSCWLHWLMRLLKYLKISLFYSFSRKKKSLPVCLCTFTLICTYTRRVCVPTVAALTTYLLQVFWISLAAISSRPSSCELELFYSHLVKRKTRVGKM